MPEKVVVIYSGGMDSFTVLHNVISEGYIPYAVTFDYGQRHDKEICYAKQVCRELGITHQVVDLRAISQLIGGSSLTKDSKIAVPEGHYAEDNMKSTVVPNRNMILISLATGYAASIGASKVFYGAHSGDHTIYPDCRPEFVKKINEVTYIANYEPIEVLSPYLHKSKIEILTDGLKMGLDYSKTWTCYNGRELACGKCGSCIERLEAFDKNQQVDPILYE
ncbi:7-cyano-7-deazaguanine synthase QueC [Shewanella algae]|uniref:7-cyano-7-deazaguanine synthase QueC n=1 Tax=Shewanella algae TaxID=38313 RepID=UPI001183AE1A|nr:7-cyano-7-deazaguanine synthase QueC [Shewanella algae]MBO2643875.1 7-cyano-7-deazaguanine synthase QueC [Shewanella algae]QTE95370.1 7-cyano-7-deazaguanine synthase QueC [Shewanella algae]TVL50788.1 7-cyano-7-deazaguanine synthase [Shewanella algae]